MSLCCMVSHQLKKTSIIVLRMRSKHIVLVFYWLLLMRDNSVHASREMKREKLFCGHMLGQPTESKIL